MIKTTIMLPEELHQKIKEYGFKNKLSLGEVVRQSIEKALGPLSQESQNTPKPVVTVSDPRQKAVKEGSDKQDALIREVLVNGTAEPVVFETPKARAISKFKKRIPLSKEMEEKILNPGEKTVSRPRGELDIDNYV